MCFRTSVAPNVAWGMTKILESIDRPMSEIGSKPSWMTEAAQSLFGTLIMTKDRSRPSRMLKKAVLFVRRSSLVRRKEHMAEDGSLWLMAYSTDKDDLVLF